MVNKIILLAFATVLTTSCVSSKVHKELESKYARLKREHRKTKDDLKSLQGDFDANQLAAEQLNDAYDKARTERDELRQKYETTLANYNALKDSYDALEKNSSEAMASNSRRNRELLTQLEQKEQALSTERSRLEKLERDLQLRSQRVDELESLIMAQDAKMQALKNAISKAMRNFEGKGLTVEERNGKVYISMENKLLFASGSWSIGAQGKQAVNQLGKVLSENPDIAVLIEGHTDNDPYLGTGIIKDNWDLSTKRATAIVTLLLENKAIDPKNLTAAGRGEFAPISDNNSIEGKSRNRRIEVILTPKLDEITKLLNKI